MAGQIIREEQISDCRLILGDCLDVMPLLGKVGAVLTDPPYGIADKWQGGFGHGWANARKDAVKRNKWDSEPMDDAALGMVLAAGKDVIIWGGNHFNLPPSRCWFIWNKPERGFTLAEAEMAWTNRDNVVRVFDYKRSDTDRTHPTQKPVELMKWCLGFLPDARTILDPFMGSGTTLVACAKLGRKGIGIEIDPDYFEMACKRVDEAYKQPDLFIEPPKQMKQTGMDI